MRYLLTIWLLLVSLTVFCQAGRDDIRQQLIRKKWVLAEKRSSLGGSREALSSPGVVLTFTDKGTGKGTGTCTDVDPGSRLFRPIRFQWTLTVDTYGEPVVRFSLAGNSKLLSSNPNNFIFNRDMAPYPSKEFNVRMVSTSAKNRLVNTPTRPDDVQLRFTPVRTEKTIVHYFFN